MTPISTLRHLELATSFNKIQDDNFSPLMLAAKKGDCDQMNLLLDQAIDLNHSSIQDALCYAAKMGHEKVVELMIKKGVNPNPDKTYDIFKDAWLDRLTAMGHAIENRHGKVIEVLLNHELKMDDVFRKGVTPEKALDLFFSQHPHFGNNIDLLRFILSKGAQVHSLNQSTIFNIAIFANSEELAALIEAGFDPKSIYFEERNRELKNKNDVQYIPEINLLDLAVMQAEKANLFKEDTDSIKKVALLLENGANPLSCNNYCNKNYLHQVSHPSLIKLFGEREVNVQAEALLERFCENKIKPIECAHTKEAVDLLCQLGVQKDNAPFLKDSSAHKEALIRIGFDPQKGLEQFDEQGRQFLIKAYKERDLSAFVALLGEGVDVNQRKKTDASWTSLHRLFSEINYGSVYPEFDFVSIARENLEIRLIDMLIKHGATPLKDELGQTPLMCLSFHPFNTAYNNRIINKYIQFEAEYYHLDPEEYRKKFFALREGGYTSVNNLCGPNIIVPIKEVIDQFWASFKTHQEFNPKPIYNPTAEWNQMREILEGKG